MPPEVQLQETLCFCSLGDLSSWLQVSFQGENSPEVRDVFIYISHVILKPLWEVASLMTNLCNLEVWEESPPNDEAIVLNSTCLIVGASSDLFW
jgi:hypothetical protein